MAMTNEEFRGRNVGPDPESIPEFEQYLEEELYTDEGDLLPLDRDEHASLYMQVVAKKEARIRHIERMRNFELSKITAVYERMLEPFRRQRDFFLEMLENYLREINQANPNDLRRKFSSGEISFGRISQVVEIDDEQAFCQNWAGSEYVREKVVYSPDKAAIKAAIKKTGEVIKGADLVTNDRKFKWEIYNG